ncbi:MAG: Tol-Pal system beta propeller repeat protein TolB [Syntrophobacteraceae bacterium]|nr:Tol-Pal system beta propeller repeat protein TolB [Syntrophobacteraceae bacterium]
MFAAKRSLLLVGCCLLLLGAAGLRGAFAQTIYLDINNANFQKIPIAVPDFKSMSSDQQLSHQMADLLNNDLNISGVFRCLDPKGFPEDGQRMGLEASQINFQSWKQVGANFLARASYQVQGGSVRLDGRLFDATAGKLVGTPKSYGGDAGAWRQMVHAFANDILQMVTGQAGVFNTKVAFVQRVGGGKEIFVCDFDGYNPVQLTHDNSIDLSPVWSPDGSRIAYVSYRDGSPKIYVINVASGATHLICGYPGMNITPAWRPGGNELAVALSKGGSQDLYLVNSSGGIERKLNVGFGSSISVSPNWSPDGRKLAYVSNEAGGPQIYIYDLSSGQKKRLTYSGKYNTSPAWSPKGDWIAYCAQGGGGFDIYVIRPDGGDAHAVTHGGRNEAPRWSPDGRMIVYSSGYAIRIMDANGTRDWQLMRSPGGAQGLPDWSPRVNGK